ncbi:spindle pole body interacting protein [Glonium stellatum]|uniref:Spindle pole body interacting protein n=1 Tax=Glonium stellatum TaxID=574774 RepID=A0A8E2JU82_9PEZI|nr:spindle pole body interacting protein [Glonium stellatum]
MTSIIAQRPATNGVTAAQNVLQRQPSFSSFPASRSPSSLSMRNNKPTRSPQPATVPESAGSPHSSPNHSRGSSLSAARAANRRESNRKIRSQYPSNSSENHVEYILVASFDIDRGSVMEHQYPAPISGDEHMLAELMLPDQAHVRSQDWTIFFLHKDTSAEEEAKEERRERRRRRRRKKDGQNGDDADAEPESHDDEEGDPEEEDETDDDFDEEEETDDDEGVEGPPLIYVLNLVNTKQDNNAKRGAVVKAMAICTRHSFLHIYKPLLLLALEEYFRVPVPETLASLYNAVNSMDLSLMPRLSPLEGFILQASDAKDMFIEKFDQMIQQRMTEDAERNSLPSSTSSNISPVRQTPQRYTLPRDTHEFESRVLYNGIPIPIKVPTAICPETVGDFSLIKLIQTFSTPHSTSPQPFALHPHLTTSGAYTHPIIVLVNALLTQKRIVFLGHNRPSGEVAEAVLAACALASGGLLRGFTRHAFPYTDLTKIEDLLKVPGFIAGVTNPAFAHKPEWWDLLCDLPTGRMKISHRIEAAPVTEGLLYFQQQQQGGLSLNGSSTGTGASLGAQMAGAVTGGGDSKNAHADSTGDSQFMESLLQSIANRHGEAAIRSKWRFWVQKFTRIAAAFEECVYGASALYIGAHETDAGAYGVQGHGFVWGDESARMRELAANVHRVEGWRSTRSYYSFVQDLARRWTKRPSAAIYLAFSRAVEEAGSGTTSTNLADSEADISTGGMGTMGLDTSLELSPPRPPGEQLQYDTILQLLAVVPESNSGLFYISLGLFHPRADVRVSVVRLLERLVEHPAGRHFWASLGRFAKLAFFRVKREEGGMGK